MQRAYIPFIQHTDYHLRHRIHLVSGWTRERTAMDRVVAEEKEEVGRGKGVCKKSRRCGKIKVLCRERRQATHYRDVGDRGPAVRSLGGRG